MTEIKEAAEQSTVRLQDLRASEPKFSWKVALAWFVIVTAIFYLALGLSGEAKEADPIFWIMGPAQGLFAASIYYGGYVWIRRWAYGSMLKRVTAESLEARAESLQDDLEKDFFNNLVKINFKYIDKYYLQTQIQADKAFTMSAIAAFAGFLIIAAGVVQMYIGRLEPAYLTTTAGLVSEFIAAVFFYLYNKTILKMAEYHRKLVLTQNIGLALRITQDLPEKERVAAQAALVERLSADINALLASSAKEA